MIVTVSSVRGSPGATSWALLLASAWPPGAAHDRVVVEADCAGGVVGARYRVGVDPGAVSLISACRRPCDRPAPGEHGRRLADGLWLVPGPEVAEQAVPAWRSGASDVAAALAADHGVWVADLGRSGPDTPVLALAGVAALNVVVTGAAVEDIVQVPARVAALSRLGPTAVLLIGRPAYGEEELHRFFAGRALWVVPATDGLPELAIRAIQGGRARRSAVWRAAAEVAADLAALCRPRTLGPDRSDGPAAASPEPAAGPVEPGGAVNPAGAGPPPSPDRRRLASTEEAAT